jgi:transposase InsO family protein
VSVGSTGDSYDNALAETVIGLFKTEEIHRRGPWTGLEDVEFATFEWVAWYNGSRLLEPLGTFRRSSSRRPTMTARLLQLAWRFSRNELSGKPGALHLRLLLLRGHGFESRTAHQLRRWLLPPASVTRDLCSSHFVAKRIAAYLLDLLERPLDGG